MNIDDFIQNAIDDGEQRGADALEPLQRAICLVSELEVRCDKDGVDAFLDCYVASDLRMAAGLLRAAGATAIADGLVEIAENLPHPDDSLLSRVNDLVSARSGYNYDSLACTVADQLAGTGKA
jgi:hypothetical protein